MTVERSIVITDYDDPVQDFVLQMIQITEDVNHFEACHIMEKLKANGEYEILADRVRAMGIL